MKLKIKKLAPSRYAMLADGRGTGIYISKGEPPKYGCPQEWDVCLEDARHTYLFSCKGLGLCVEAIQKIVDATSRNVQSPQLTK